jgi:hypothetical protein
LQLERLISSKYPEFSFLHFFDFFTICPLQSLDSEGSLYNSVTSRDRTDGGKIQ